MKFIKQIALIIIALTVAVSVNAQQRKSRQQSQPVVTVTELANPAIDETQPWNQDGESLKDFLAQWAASQEFRADRSRYTKMLMYFDPSTGSYEVLDGWDDPSTIYDLFLTSFSDQWPDMLAPHTKESKKGRTRDYESFEWSAMSADTAVYNMAWESENSYDGYGSAMTLVFGRLDGKWYLMGIVSAG